MVQAHLLHAGLSIARPTEDIDVVIHIETGAISWDGARRSLSTIGYRLRYPSDRRDPAHRFVRADPADPGVEHTVDVSISDHPGP